MENASKALVMAGGVLIALLVIGAVMLMVNNLSVYQNAQDINTKTSQIAEFNNKFIPYERNDLSILELKTVYNKIEDNNENHPEWKIETNIKDLGINFDNIESSDKLTKTFKCIGIDYTDDEGRICIMNFSAN